MLIQLVVVAAVIYLIFPFDLIPDSMGLVGLTDDFIALAVIFVVVLIILNVARTSIIEQHDNRE
jgi:uncharacterized membrane protein YkvA (DUF1232 family)